MALSLTITLALIGIILKEPIFTLKGVFLHLKMTFNLQKGQKKIYISQRLPLSIAKHEQMAL